MEYRRFGNTIIARFDAGEDFFEKLKRISLHESVKLGSVSGLGTFSRMNVGVYDLEKRQFAGNDFEGMFEIVSLTGTINTMDGKYYSHIHAAAADADGHVYGGHLSSATIGATAELVLTVLDGCVDRKQDEETGLNIFKF
ncbi:MAG: DNA-binding protein [Lachnospiraceae bacterium]|nr:DNA-binding protein [Lachnospiraceae bacterium]